MNSLNEYTAPYLAPFSPSVHNDFKDGLFKANITEMYDRPKSFSQKNTKRLSDDK